MSKYIHATDGRSAFILHKGNRIDEYYHCYCINTGQLTIGSSMTTWKEYGYIITEVPLKWLKLNGVPKFKDENV